MKYYKHFTHGFLPAKDFLKLFLFLLFYYKEKEEYNVESYINIGR